MWKPFVLVLVLGALPPAAIAQDAQPTDASILELMEVIDARENVASVDRYVSRMIQSSIDRAAAGQDLGPERRAVLDRMEQKIFRMVQEETSWERMRPEIVAIYRETFSQEEIDAMVEFYGSPVGQSVIDKMPGVMRKSMQVTHRQMMSVMPKIRQIQQETARELQSLE